MMQHDSIAKAKKVLVSSNTAAAYPDNIDELYCEFMTLKIMNEDYDASKAQLSPGGTVDEFWHTHVLDTAGYASFFWDINDGDMVHHDVLKSLDSDELIDERQEKTRSVYKETFGKECSWLSGINVKEEKECPNVSVKEEQVEDQKENQKQAATFGIFVKTLTGKTHKLNGIKYTDTIWSVKLKPRCRGYPP